MKAVLVDTSGFYAALDPKDPRHPEAKTWFHRADVEQWHLLTHNYIVHEAWSSIQARLGWGAVEQWRRVFLRRCETIWVDETLHEIAAARCSQARQRRLSLTDCVSIELMHRQNLWEILAFDEDLSAAGGRSPA